MPTPSNIINVIELSSSNPSITDTVQVTSFLTSPTKLIWAAKVTDNDGNLVFYATHSGANSLPFSHPLGSTIKFNGLNAVTSSNTTTLAYLFGS